MADADQSLKILIELGVIGEKDAEAAKQLIEENAKAVGDLSQSVPEAAASWEKYKNVLGSGNTEAEGFNLRGREMKKILNELNAIAPGTSHAVDGVMKALSGAAAGGGFAAVMLAIEAIKTYWDMYKDSVEKAAEAQAKAMDQIRDTTRSAREEMEAFAAAKEKALKPDDEEAAKLARDQAVQAAQFRGKREMLRAEQEAAMSQAQTPEEKDAVQKKFAGKATELDAQEQSSKLALLNNTIEGLTKKISGLESGKTDLVSERDSILESIKTARRLGLSTDSQTTDLATVNTKIKAIDDQILEATRKRTNYAGQASTDQAVFNTDQFTRNATRNITIGKAVTEGGLTTEAQNVSQSQREANMELTRLFSQYNGGLQAMMAILQNAVKNQTSQQSQMDALNNALKTLQERQNNHPL